MTKPFSIRLPLLALLLLFVGSSLWAQIPDGYYDNAEGKTGDELKVALHNIIKGHTVISYAKIRDAYAYTDCDDEGLIIDLYSNYRYRVDDNGSYQKEGDSYNREHTWPQSWFKVSGAPKSDLFHVYPVDGYVNGQRSNHPYGEVDKPKYTSTNGSKLGPCVTEGYTGTAFEPADEYKGDIARGLFYMSVRYYSEDSKWGSSGMTNKSQILPWAMTMLLRWSDHDPVSQKEIDRNNTIYGGYQGNRNPFIDHPEYAHMIWDENWTAGTSYDITCATGLQHGTIDVPATAVAGSTVTLKAVPDPTYEVDTWSVWKTGDASTTVTVSSNGTFTMPKYAVTVSATFKQNTTLYDIAQRAVDNGTIGVSASQALSGTTITLTATPATGYKLLRWYVYKTGDMNTMVTVTNNSFTMPPFNVTVGASFGLPSDYAFKKVTGQLDDWSGEYLIVCEKNNVAFNGSLDQLDAESNTIDVTISGNAIDVTDKTDAARFVIAPSGTSYTIKSASGQYIGRTTNSNGMNTSDATAYANTISYNAGNVDIVGTGGAYLRYNESSNQKRFRYFQSSTYTGQQAIQLYKKSGSITLPTHTITFHQSSSSYTQTVNEYETTTLIPNAFTRKGYEFDGWSTKEDGTGDFYVDQANVTLLSDLDLYAQWEKKYAITCSTDEHGTISASADEAVEETTITLTATPAEGYTFYRWDVTDAEGNEVLVVDDQFDMPANDVTVSAIFVYFGAPSDTYTLVTKAEQLQEGLTCLIVNVEKGKALGAQKDNNRYADDVIINDGIITSIGSACELTLGKAGENWTFYDATNSGYLYAAGSSSNLLKVQTKNDANGQWRIVIAANGVATIKAQGNNTRNWLRYNSSSTLFSCYASGQQDVCLFVKQADASSLILANNDAALPEGEKNTDLIAAHSGEKANVVLYGRKLNRSGAWNTLCLPFDLNISGTPLDGATVKRLSSATLSGNTLTLDFATVQTIEAGKPYVVKWTTPADDIIDPVFTGVTIGSEQPVPVDFTDHSGQFVGCFSTVAIPGEDQSLLYLGPNNTLYYPSGAMSIGAFRTFFRLSSDKPGAAMRFVLNLDEEPSAITTAELTDRQKEVYNLNGQRVAQPRKGIYVHNGKKIIK